ncbi:MAG: aminoacetone oxidase family FAD-binding enzyme, partial [Planctomycetota bacterium]
TTSGDNAKFLHSPLAALGPDEVVALFEAEGVATKVESTGKVFPVSNRAVDVQQALLRMLERSGAELRLGEAVTDISRSVGDTFHVATTHGAWRAPRVVLASGGKSYPGCGTTGDGYGWAKQLGHRIVPPRPALAPLTSSAAWVHELQGVTVPDAAVRIRRAGAESKRNRLPTYRGGLLFTHFGLSGPTAMNASRAVTERPDADDWRLEVDLAPSAARESLERRLADPSAGGTTVGAFAAGLAPRSVAEAVVHNAELPVGQRLAELSKPGRRRLLDAVKQTPIPIAGSLGFKKAEVTAGGVGLADVDSRTLESRVCPGLFLVGEVLDLDGPIGGYNFQAAFSTGWLAGDSV